MTAPVSSAESSYLRMARTLQQRALTAYASLQDGESRMRAKQVEADMRLQALDAAERVYREEMSRPVYTLELEDGTKFEVLRGGGVAGSGPRGALAMGVDDLVRDAGFPEAKTREEAVLQKIIVLQLNYGSEEVRDQTRKFLETAKKAIALLSQMVQMLQDGWKSGTIPLIPVNGSSGDDELKIWSSGMRITAGAGNDLIYADRYSAVDAGDGNDTVMADELNSVDGGAGDDMISAWSNSHVTGGAGSDTIKVWSGGTADGGAGDDVIRAWSESQVSGGAGDDVIGAWSDSRVSGGSGDDVIKAGARSVVDGGEGDDMIDAWSEAIVDGGAGNDVIDVWSDSTARGGDGNDIMTGWSDSTIDGGAGDDLMWVTSGTARGGVGDDLIMGSGTLDGGAGNDGIIASWGSRVSGGQGDDQIQATGKVDISFGKGDGRDTVAARSFQHYDAAKISQDGPIAVLTRTSGVTFNLGQGLSHRDMQIGISGSDMTLDFGGGDSITILDYRNTSATMVFSDGSRMKVSDFVASGSPQTPPGRAVDLQV
jgi:hypothetical protein